ncbi:MAG: hypothetical protein RI965_1285 [Bacteroidota bacterium]|jgi:subtilisin family serine protease
MRFLKFSLPFFAIVLLISCSKDEIANKQLIPQLDISSGKAPSLASEENAKYISGDYIVVFNNDVDVDKEVGNAEKAHGVKAKFKYKYALKGFSATLPLQALEGLRSNPKVKYIEQDQQMNAITTQTSVPSWGIDRIDQVSRPLSNSYDYKNTGLGVTAYIIDTGIKFNHSEFGLRAFFGFDAFNGNGSDANGHGTHVSGTVGGNTMGVAKEISLVAVRVLDASGSGSTSGVAAGIDWAVNNHSNSPAVANMSLGGGASTVIDDAVKRAVSDGIVMCVAAGNSSRNASQFSPARVVEAITVGATTSSDALASYSNYGSIVDILAPGSNITSSWNTSTIATNTISGTSMATPHVTGVAALYLQSYPSSKPSDVQNELISKATLGKISLSGAAKSAGTQNRLLFTNY